MVLVNYGLFSNLSPCACRENNKINSSLFCLWNNFQSHNEPQPFWSQMVSQLNKLPRHTTNNYLWLRSSFLCEQALWESTIRLDYFSNYSNIECEWKTASKSLNSISSRVDHFCSSSLYGLCLSWLKVCLSLKLWTYNMSKHIASPLCHDLTPGIPMRLWLLWSFCVIGHLKTWTCPAFLRYRVSFLL